MNSTAPRGTHERRVAVAGTQCRSRQPSATAHSSTSKAPGWRWQTAGQMPGRQPPWQSPPALPGAGSYGTGCGSNRCGVGWAEHNLALTTLPGQQCSSVSAAQANCLQAHHTPSRLRPHVNVMAGASCKGANASSTSLCLMRGHNALVGLPGCASMPPFTAACAARRGGRAGSMGT
jgi:hypothetical protein